MHSKRKHLYISIVFMKLYVPFKQMSLYTYIHILNGRTCFRNFVNCNSFTSNDHAVGIIESLFYKWGNGSTERLTDLTRDTWEYVVESRFRLGSWVHLLTVYAILSALFHWILSTEIPNRCTQCILFNHSSFGSALIMILLLTCDKNLPQALVS